jgi:hypothetical protein
MMRLKPKSAYYDFKSGMTCKILFFLGIIFLILYLTQISTQVISNDENLAGILRAFVILFFGLSALSYFLSCQFSKLAQIAKDIENNPDFIDKENNKE